jgi:hypothetical protein
MGIAQVVPGAEQRALAAWPPPTPRQQGKLTPPQAVAPVPQEPSALQLSLRVPQEVPAAMQMPSWFTQALVQTLPGQAGWPAPPQGWQVPAPAPVQAWLAAWQVRLGQQT